MMKKTKNYIVSSLVLGLPVLFSQNAFAEHYHGKNRSHHYHGPAPQEVIYVQPRPVVYREVRYFPHQHCARPVVYPYYVSGYDPYFTPRSYWGVRGGSNGWGFSVHTGW